MQIPCRRLVVRGLQPDTSSGRWTQTPEGTRVPGSFIATNFGIYFEPSEAITSAGAYSDAYFQVPLATICKCVHTAFAWHSCVRQWFTACVPSLESTHQAPGQVFVPRWCRKPHAHLLQEVTLACWCWARETGGSYGLASRTLSWHQWLE